MKPEEHKARHKMLHDMLDELVADMIDHTIMSPSKTTVMQLMTWSNEQQKNPTDLKIHRRLKEEKNDSGNN